MHHVAIVQLRQHVATAMTVALLLVLALIHVALAMPALAAQVRHAVHVVLLKSLS